jgi:hypothetical protein
MPPEQREGQAIDALHGQKSLRLGLPNEGVAAPEVGTDGDPRPKPLDRPGNPLEQAGKGFLKVHVTPVAKAV